MSNKEYLIYEKEDLVAIADAVRAKTGSSETYLVSELPAAINNIVDGGSEEIELLLSSHLENKSNPHEVSLTQLGVNATAAELNYVDGVTSNIQT